MIVIHHLGVSQSDRIVWLCEELGVPYELKIYARDPVTRAAPPEYAALSTFGKAPVIEDDGRVIGESGAIMEYIIHRHGGGRLTVAPDAPNYADYLFWWHFANASMMPSIMKAGLVGDSDSPFTTNLRNRAENAHAAVEARLGEVPYFAGDAFTAADIIMLFPLTTMRLFVPRDFAAAPNTRAYLKRIAERPAFQIAMAKADPGLAIPLD